MVIHLGFTVAVEGNVLSPVREHAFNVICPTKFLRRRLRGQAQAILQSMRAAKSVGPAMPSNPRDLAAERCRRSCLMTPKPDDFAAEGYLARVERQVPGLHDLHQMVGLLLAVCCR